MQDRHSALIKYIKYFRRYLNIKTSKDLITNISGSSNFEATSCRPKGPKGSSSRTEGFVLIIFFFFFLKGFLQYLQYYRLRFFIFLNFILSLIFSLYKENLRLFATLLLFFGFFSLIGITFLFFVVWELDGSMSPRFHVRIYNIFYVYYIHKGTLIFPFFFIYFYSFVYRVVCVRVLGRWSSSYRSIGQPLR